MKSTTKYFHLMALGLICMCMLPVQAQKLSKEQRDGYGQAVENARSSGFDKSSIVWEEDFPHKEADIIRYLNEAEVLVGSISVGASKSGVSLYRSLMLINSQTGKSIWEADRKQRSKLLTVEPEIIMVNTAEQNLSFQALNRKDGKTLWEFRGKAPYDFDYDPQSLFVISKDKRKKSLVKLNPANGTVIWEKSWESDEVGKRDEIDLFREGEKLFIHANGYVFAFSARNGEALWQAQVNENPGLFSQVRLFPHGMISYDEDVVSLWNLEDGKRLWQQAISKGDVQLVAASEDHLIRVIRHAAGYDVVQGISPQDGNMMWQHQLPDMVCSALMFHEGQLLFTTEFGLTGLDPTRGVELFRTSFPFEFAMKAPKYNPANPYEQLPDLFQLYGRKLMIDRDQGGLASVDLQSKKLGWGFFTNLLPPNPSDIILPLPSVAQQYAQMQLDLKIMADATIGSKRNTQSQPTEVTIKNGFLQYAQKMHDQTYEQTRRILDDPNSSSQDRQFAYQTRISSSEMMVAQTKLDVQLGKMQAWSNLSLTLVSGVLDIAEKRAVNIYEGKTNRAQMEFQAALEGRSNRFQGKYAVYMMPGTILVDLEKETWTPIRTTTLSFPQGMAEKMYGLQLPTIGISPDQEQIIHVGPGIDPDRFRKGSAGGFSIVRSNMQAYRIPKQSLRKLPEFPRRSEGETWGIAVKQGERGLAYMMATGADINAQNPISGLTPLLSAGTHGRQYTVMESLLESGADPNILNHDGETILDIMSSATMFSSWDSRSKKDAECIKMIDAAGGKKGEEVIQEKMRKMGASSGLFGYALRGEINPLKALIDSKTNIDTAMFGLSLLAWAMHANQREIADFLIEKGADRPSFLRYAILKNQAEWVHFLCDRKGDPIDLTSLYRKFNYFDLAVKKGHEEVAEVLLQQTGGLTAMGMGPGLVYIATMRGHTGMVQWLLENGANPNQNGYSSLWIAVPNGYIEIVKLLLAHGDGTQQKKNRKQAKDLLKSSFKEMEDRRKMDKKYNRITEEKEIAYQEQKKRYEEIKALLE